MQPHLTEDTALPQCGSVDVIPVIATRGRHTPYMSCRNDTGSTFTLICFSRNRKVTWCSSVWMLLHSQRTFCQTPKRCQPWLTLLVQPCECVQIPTVEWSWWPFVFDYLLMIWFLLTQHRTRGGFVALSPISPQDLFLQPINSDVDSGQEKNLVRRRRGIVMQALILELGTGFLTASTGCVSCDDWHIRWFYFSTPKV